MSSPGIFSSGPEYKYITLGESKKLTDHAHAVHCCLYARGKNPLISMHMRFDGRIGFPGGLVDPGQTVLEALRRELVEEINLGSDLHPNEEDYLFSHIHPTNVVCNHFYGKELSEQHFLAMEKNVFTAHDFGEENLGMIRVPLVPMPGGTKECFSKFLQNCFAGNAKDQLLNFLICSNLMTLDKVQEALRISKDLC